MKSCCIWYNTATAIPFIYSFSGNSAASAPISTLMCLWAIYIFPGSVYIFPPAEQANPSWEHIIRSQTHECGNWDWGPDIPFLGIFVSNFRHFVFAVNTMAGFLPSRRVLNHIYDWRMIYNSKRWSLCTYITKILGIIIWDACRYFFYNSMSFRCTLNLSISNSVIYTFHVHVPR